MKPPERRGKGHRRPSPGIGLKWHDAYTEALRDKQVYLCPDADEAGIYTMTRIANLLIKDQPRRIVRWVNLGFPLGSKKDVSDFLAENPDDAYGRLRLLIENAGPRWR